MLEVKFDVYEFFGGNPDDFDNWGLVRSHQEREDAIRDANHLALDRGNRYKVMLVVLQEIHGA